MKTVCELGETLYYVANNTIIPVVCDGIFLKDNEVVYSFDVIACYCSEKMVLEDFFSDYNMACDRLKLLRETRGYYNV